MQAHVPVMLAQVLDGLALTESGYYVDATFGRGGHSAEILNRLGPEGRLLAIDRDNTAVAEAEQRFAGDARFQIAQRPFAEIATAMGAAWGGERASGVLFDFGVSSPQLDEAARGFSFLREGPLDMRMDTQQEVTAESYLAAVDEATLKRDLRELGEERLAARIAPAIIAARDRGALRTTLDLANVVEAATPVRVKARSQRHPATQTFQAIRMRINDELGQIKRALGAIVDCLRVGGRVCFITFHSLEDRPVKHFLRDACAEDPVYRGLPDVPEHAQPRMRLIGKAQTANDEELARNPRARSARLRIAERLR